MNIQEKLKYFTENMNLNFFIKNSVKLELLDKDIRRYIKKELVGEKIVQFTSQDLRTYVLALEKVHKQLNKKVSFYEFDKYLVKKYTKIDSKILTQETHNLAQYINGARVCQMLLSTNNYWAAILRMVEIQYQQEKEASDEVFNHEILSGLLEIF
jgi:hypothetical protein